MWFTDLFLLCFFFIYIFISLIPELVAIVEYKCIYRLISFKLNPFYMLYPRPVSRLMYNYCFFFFFIHIHIFIYVYKITLLMKLPPFQFLKYNLYFIFLSAHHFKAYTASSMAYFYIVPPIYQMFYYGHISVFTNRSNNNAKAVNLLTYHHIHTKMMN